MDIDSLTIAGFRRLQKVNGEGVDPEAWARVNDQITEVVGVNEAYINYLSKRARAISLRSTGNRFDQTLADIAEHEAREYEKVLRESKGDSFTASLISLSRMQGYRVDPEVTSVREYFELIKAYNNVSDQEQRRLRGRHI